MLIVFINLNALREYSPHSCESWCLASNKLVERIFLLKRSSHWGKWLLFIVWDVGKIKGRIGVQHFFPRKGTYSFAFEKNLFLNLCFRFTHTYVCVSGGKKCSFFRKFGVLYFFVSLLPPLWYLLFSLITDKVSNWKFVGG